MRNSPCPCQSGVKYKKCCGIFHQGALPSNALLLMKSRYCAYALNLSKYIIDTTYKDNSDYTDNIKLWQKSIEEFSTNTQFLGLNIISFTQKEDEAFVEFEATLSSGLLQEKSYFVKESGKWFYHSGDIK